MPSKEDEPGAVELLAVFDEFTEIELMKFMECVDRHSEETADIEAKEVNLLFRELAFQTSKTLMYWSIPRDKMGIGESYNISDPIKLWKAGFAASVACSSRSRDIGNDEKRKIWGAMLLSRLWRKFEPNNSEPGIHFEMYTLLSIYPTSKISKSAISHLQRTRALKALERFDFAETYTIYMARRVWEKMPTCRIGILVKKIEAMLIHRKAATPTQRTIKNYIVKAEKAGKLVIPEPARKPGRPQNKTG